jgi:hypothetical protein
MHDGIIRPVNTNITNLQNAFHAIYLLAKAIVKDIKNFNRTMNMAAASATGWES